MDWARILAFVTGTVDQELLARNEYLAAENLSMLKKPFGHEIGLPVKTATDDIRQSTRAPLFCDSDSPHVF